MGLFLKCVEENKPPSFIRLTLGADIIELFRTVIYEVMSVTLRVCSGRRFQSNLMAVGKLGTFVIYGYKKLYHIGLRGQYYKSFYIYNLSMFVLS